MSRSNPPSRPSPQHGVQAPTAVGKPPIAPGDARPDESQDESLALPHERDESVRGTSPQPAPNPLIEQARLDIESGQVDTDLRVTPGLDAERRDALLRQRGGPGDPKR